MAIAAIALLVLLGGAIHFHLQSIRATDTFCKDMALKIAIGEIKEDMKVLGPLIKECESNDERYDEAIHLHTGTIMSFLTAAGLAGGYALGQNRKRP